MLKEWVWWQIEASLEHLGDESTIPLSDLTIFFWMALTVKRFVGLLQQLQDYRLSEGMRGQADADESPYTAVLVQRQVFEH